MSLAEQIDNLLPQTQCRQCDFPSCRDYAAAIAAGRANINQCPPGGQVSIDAIAALLQVASTTLNPAHGQTTPKQVARIDEAACIGCRLCIKACPVDCIIGAAKLMHTVLSQDCTGCRLCLAVCPTDCIDMHTAQRAPGPGSRWPDFTHAQVERARHKHAHKQQRAAQRVKARAGPVPKSRAALQHEIALAVARQRARLVGGG